MRGPNGIPIHGVPSTRLRLVGTDAVGPAVRSQERIVEPSASAARARREVARENRSASMLSDADVRVVFARDVAEAIEGGRAAILRPEKRHVLVSRATELGLRAFDASLIIAVVQDSARRSDDAGMTVTAAKPGLAVVHAGADARESHPAVGGASARTGRDSAVQFAMIAVGIGMCLLGAMIAWLRG